MSSFSPDPAPTLVPFSDEHQESIPNRLLAVSLILVFACVLVAGISDASAAPPLSGAIFTTNINGTRVNQNSFPAKCDVYLDGGPGQNAPQTAAGLPDGDYYFQVTDPSGKTLLSTDPVANRQFHVSSGIIVGLSGAGNHGMGNDTDHPPARTIQLCDFLDTPNPGGVYKAWVTPIGDFIGNPLVVDNACGRGCFHGFLPAASKTDNFKVKGAPLACIAVQKVVDGVWTAGWKFWIFDPNGAEIQGALYTNATSKECNVFNLVAGTYLVVEDQPDGYAVYDVRLDGKFLKSPDDTVVVKVGTRDNTSREIVFYNTKQ